MGNFVSDCCQAPPRGNGDNDLMDYGICSDCGDHCEYIDLEEEELPEEIPLIPLKETSHGE